MKKSSFSGKRGHANFSHFYHEFLRKPLESRQSWKKLAWKTFSTLRVWKTWPGQLFPFFPQISEEAFGTTKLVEAWPTFSTRRAYKTWPGQVFPFFPRISEKVFEVTKIVEACTTFVISKTSTEISETSGKSWPGHVFQARRVENVGQASFFHNFRDSLNFLRNSEEVLFTLILFCFFISLCNYWKFTIVVAFFLRNPKNHCKFTMISMVSMIS